MARMVGALAVVAINISPCLPAYVFNPAHSAIPAPIPLISPMNTAVAITDTPIVKLPYLCKRLCEVSDHHHNQVHLADLLPGTTRGSFLQVRFSYLCLRALLLPDEEIPEDSEILHFKLANIPNLCNNSERSALSPLAKALRSLLEEDLYKMISAIKLLDMCVGNDLYRSDQPWVINFSIRLIGGPVLILLSLP
ncbi:hypothetical protein PoB_001704700 [Plakobranchus ocellatus]|uniref:Coiled-coil SMC6 And NSE5 INteracting (CANIN) domain-containing protein n=1 Tax=Plakobranchus ocellatus TaxID=259542 RepID=A0AAV3Z5K5_9GAST|nr:hypothetical protein PoB_001704700 [Plakobranchus ocellatus]